MREQDSAEREQSDACTSVEEDARGVVACMVEGLVPDLPTVAVQPCLPRVHTRVRHFSHAHTSCRHGCPSHHLWQGAVLGVETEVSVCYHAHPTGNVCDLPCMSASQLLLSPPPLLILLSFSPPPLTSSNVAAL